MCVSLGTTPASQKNVNFSALGGFLLFRPSNIDDNNVKFCYIGLTAFLTYDILIINSGERSVKWLIDLIKGWGTK